MVSFIHSNLGNHYSLQMLPVHCNDSYINVSHSNKGVVDSLRSTRNVYSFSSVSAFEADRGFSWWTLTFFVRSFRGFIKFLCRRSVGFYSRAFLVFLMKESKKRRRKQPVNLPGAWPLMNPLIFLMFSWKQRCLVAYIGQENKSIDLINERCREK